MFSYRHQQFLFCDCRNQQHKAVLDRHARQHLERVEVSHHIQHRLHRRMRKGSVENIHITTVTTCVT